MIQNVNIYLVNFVLIMILTSSCQGDVDITIVGIVDSLEGTQVRITSDDHVKSYDSAVVQNKRLEIQATVPKADFYYLSFRLKNGNPLGSTRLIYLEDDTKYTFRINRKNQLELNDYQINSTSDTQKHLEKYLNQLSSEKISLQSARDYYYSMSDRYLDSGNDLYYKKYIDSIIYVENKQRHVIDNSRREFMRKDRSSLVTPYFVTQMRDFFENYDLYKKILDGLDENIKKDGYTQKAYSILRSHENLRIGGTIPDIVGNDLSSNPLIYDFGKKKYTLINLWASWCVTCRYQTPELKGIYQKYKTQGFDIIAISVDKDKEWWTRISKYDSIPWHNVSETVRPSDSQNVKNFKAKVLPLNYLVNSQKKIVARDFDMYELEKFLKDSIRAN